MREMRFEPAARAAVLALTLSVSAGCGNTVSGPSATPTPSGPTPTPSAPHIVFVGQDQSGNRLNVFVDQASGTSTTTIHVGDTVQWNWLSGTHSTTSGICPNGCIPDGTWDSGVESGATFQHTFPSAGSYPYFCRVHGTMMQGTVIVQ